MDGAEAAAGRCRCGQQNKLLRRLPVACDQMARAISMHGSRVRDRGCSEGSVVAMRGGGKEVCGGGGGGRGGNGEQAGVQGAGTWESRQRMAPYLARRVSCGRVKPEVGRNAKHVLAQSRPPAGHTYGISLGQQLTCEGAGVGGKDQGGHEVVRNGRGESGLSVDCIGTNTSHCGGCVCVVRAMCVWCADRGCVRHRAQTAS